MLFPLSNKSRLAKFFNTYVSNLGQMTEQELMDVIIRTKNSEQFLQECLQSVLEEIPVRQIIIIDAGSIDGTLKIASSFDKVRVYVRPDLNMGQATKYGFTVAETEWVVSLDSDIILKKGWFDDMKPHMENADAVEGCKIDHYLFNVKDDTTKSSYGRIGQTILRREPILDMDLDVQVGEDTLIKINFDKQGKNWRKVPNFLADHYPRIENTTYRRTGMILRPKPQVIYIPKEYQITEARFARKYNTITKREIFKRLLVVPIYEAYWTFKKSFWFTLAYFRLI